MRSGPGGGEVHLEIDGEEEVRGGVLPEAGAAEGGGDAVVVAGEHVVEAGMGAEPVDAGGTEQPVRGGRRLAALPAAAVEVAARAQVEEVPRRRGPAVGAAVQVDQPQGAGGHGLLPPALLDGAGGGGGLARAIGLRRAHRRAPARGRLGRDFVGWAWRSLREWRSWGALDFGFGGAAYKTVGMAGWGWDGQGLLEEKKIPVLIIMSRGHFAFKHIDLPLICCQATLSNVTIQD